MVMLYSVFMYALKGLEVCFWIFGILACIKYLRQ